MREREIDSWVMVDPLPLDPLEDAVTPESRDVREVDAAFFTAARLVLLSCGLCGRELSMALQGASTGRPQAARCGIRTL